MEVVKAQSVGDPKKGHIGVIAGPPGTGKSWFCATMAEHLKPEEVLVICTLPRELESYKYQEYDLDAVIVYDDEWLPEENQFKAPGYQKFLDVLRELRFEDEKYKGIIIDNGTEMAELAWHAALAPHGVSSPTKLGRGGNSFAPYQDMAENMAQIFTSLICLTNTSFGTKVPKLIWIPWHLQPPKGGDDSADAAGEDVEFKGELPMIKGGFRRKLGGLVGAYVHSEVMEEPVKPGSIKTKPVYKVQVVGDHRHHCKIPGAQPDTKYIDNDFRKYMELL